MRTDAAAYGRDWMSRNADKARAAMRRWRQRHPEAHRAENRAHYARSAKRRAASVARHAAHPEVHQAAHQRRRARAAQAEGTYSTQQRRALVARHDGRCGYCGVAGALQADHRIPLSRGGSHRIENIIPACRQCNCRKATSTEGEFRVRLANERLRSSEFVVVDWWPAGEIESVG